LKKSPTSRPTVELIAAAVLGLLSIAAFGIQAESFDETTTARETALFGALQFILTLGFGWMSTRAATRIEFAASLRQFALSAYRRISDIESILLRMLRKTTEIRALEAGERRPDLDLIQAMLEDAAQVVVSSRADWSDVIGEELLTLETVKSLENQREELEQSPTPQSGAPDERLRALDERIDRLVAELPVQLRLEAKGSADEARSQRRAADWIATEHAQNDGLNLNVIAGQEYPCERPFETIVPDEEVSVVVDLHFVYVKDSQGRQMGRVTNHTPLTYNAFRAALARAYGADKFTARVASATEMSKAGYCNYRVKVEAAPVRTPKKHRAHLS
jgi:hypothetical protein